MSNLFLDWRYMVYSYKLMKSQAPGVHPSLIGYLLTALFETWVNNNFFYLKKRKFQMLNYLSFN